MKCEHIAELLPDYLQGRLSAELHHNVEAHLEQCADCREEVVIWRKLSLLPVEQPGPASRARFEAMLQAYQAGRSSQPRAVRNGGSGLPPGTGTCSIGFARLWGPQRGAPRCLLSAFTRVFRWLVPNPISKTCKQCSPNSRA